MSATDGARSRRNSRVGVKEVARAAGVSVGTVSNVLNRPEVVRHETRFRVQAEMARLGFVRDESARQLRQGRSRTLAYVFLDATNPFFTDVARGAEAAAEQAGLALYLCNCNGDAGREDRYLDLLHQQRVLGILITALDYANPRLRALPEQGTPVVLVDHPADIQSASCSVAVDDKLGGEVAVAHLLEQGHERIAFAGGPFTLPQVSDRLEGARRALAAAGRQADDVVVLETESTTIAGGREAAERLIGLPASRRPTRDLLRERHGRPGRAPALHARRRRRALGRGDRGLRRHRVRDRGRRAPDVGAAAARQARPDGDRAPDSRDHRGRARAPGRDVRARADGPRLHARIDPPERPQIVRGHEPR